jgi:hypothetical protein
VRESGNGTTTVIPWLPSITHEGWEDAAVHPRVLGPYLRDYKALLARFGYQGWYYGHFGEGPGSCKGSWTRSNPPRTARSTE